MIIVKRTALVLLMFASIGLVVAIVISISFLFVYGAVILRSRNLYRELDRLIELTRFGNISIEDTLNNIDMSCLVLDATGKVTETSRRFLENRDVQRADVVGKSINAVFDEISFDDVSSKLERERQMVDVEAKEPVGFLPIFNRLGELSQIICVLGKKKLYVGPISEKAERRVSRVGRMSGFLKRMGLQRERRKESNG